MAVEPGWLRREAERSLTRLRPRLEGLFAGAPATSWPPFLRRLEERFDTLFGSLHALRRPLRFLLPPGGILATAARAWLERPAELKALDAAREADPDWFQSQRMVGGVCYVDRFAGDLAGLRARIPYFQELGLTYLHLMPLFRAAGGQQRRRLRRQQLPRGRPRPRHDGGAGRARAASSRAHGISLVLDFVFNHTSDEHDWARAGAGRRPRAPGLLLAVPRPHAARRLRAHPARDLPRPAAAAASPGGRRSRGRPLGLDHLQHLPVGPELRQPGRLRARWPGRCCSWPTRASRSCAWTRSPSSGSSWAPAARTCPRRTLIVRAFNAARPHRRPGAALQVGGDRPPRRRGELHQPAASASSPTTRC